MKRHNGLLGISGKIGSGKDEFASVIKSIDSEWQVKKFAKKLKQITSLLTGIPVEYLEDIEVKNSNLGPQWDNMTVRSVLQRVGTEAIRDQIHKNAWVNALFADFKDSSWLITDLRFENEAEAIMERGGLLVRINRPGHENTGDHPSETSLDNFAHWDYVITNDGTLEDFHKKIKEFYATI